LVHFVAQAQGDLGFGLGGLEAGLDQALEGRGDIGCLRRSKLLLNCGEQVVEKVVGHGRRKTEMLKAETLKFG
jgi:hypothetical protein